MERRFPGIRIAVPPTLVLTTDVFDRFLAENDLLDLAIHGTDDEEITRRFLEAPFPICLARQSAGLSGGSALSAGGALFQPARGLAVPALLRRVRDLHAGQPASRHSGAAGAVAGGDQTGLRLDLQPARQGLRASHAVSPGRREDGGAAAAGGGRGARQALLSRFFRRGALA